MIVNITDRYVGDDWQLEHTVTGLPAGMDVTAASLKIKASKTGATLLTKNITHTYVAGQGVITQTAPGADVTLSFEVTDTETSAFTPGVPLYYRMHMVTAGAVDNTPVDGALIPQ